jgi:hypothetical protein
VRKHHFSASGAGNPHANMAGDIPPKVDYLLPLRYDEDLDCGNFCDFADGFPILSKEIR